MRRVQEGNGKIRLRPSRFLIQVDSGTKDPLDSFRSWKRSESKGDTFLHVNKGRFGRGRTKGRRDERDRRSHDVVAWKGLGRQPNFDSLVGYPESRR